VPCPFYCLIFVSYYSPNACILMLYIITSPAGALASTVMSCIHRCVFATKGIIQSPITSCSSRDHSVCQASTNRNQENSECRRCGLSVRKGAMGVHSAGKVWYLRLPCLYTIFTFHKTALMVVFQIQPGLADCCFESQKHF